MNEALQYVEGMMDNAEIMTWGLRCQARGQMAIKAGEELSLQELILEMITEDEIEALIMSGDLAHELRKKAVYYDIAARLRTILNKAKEESRE